MNTHLNFLWNAVFAPRAAVDLARQHPNTARLGWGYVLATAIWSFVADWITRTFVRPLTGYVETPSVQGFEWLDSVAAIGIFSAIFYALMYVAARWFWRGMIGAAADRNGIDAANATSFACSLVLLLPQFFILEMTQTSPGIVQFLGWMIPLAAALFLSTIYFSHGPGISMASSFWLNVLFVVLYSIAVAVFMLVAFFGWSILTGAPLGELLGIPEVAQ